MNNGDKKAFKSGIWYTVSNFISKGFIFLTTPIFSRLMTEEAFGEYSSFITWQSLLLLVLPLALYSTVNRARFDFPDEMERFLSSITFAGGVFTASVYVIVVVLIDKFEIFFSMNKFYIALMFLFVFFEPAMANFQALKQVQFKYKTVTIISLLSCFLSVGVSILLSFMMKDQMLGRVLGYDVTLILFYVFIFIWIFAHGRKPSLKHIKYALRLSIPLVPHLVSMYILGQCDKLVIQKMVGNEAVAFYSIGYTCALVISMLSNSVNGAMSPWLFSKLEQKDHTTIKKVNRYYVGLFTVLTLGLMLISPEIEWILGGEKYIESRIILMPVMAGCCCNFIYTSYVNVENYLKKPIIVSIGTTCVAVINIVLNVIFIEKYGYQAAAFTTLFSYFILLLYHFVMVRVLKYGDLYNNALNIGCAVGICVFSIAFLFVYQTFWRYVMIIVYAAAILFLILKYRKIIKRLLAGLLK